MPRIDQRTNAETGVTETRTWPDDGQGGIDAGGLITDWDGSTRPLTDDEKAAVAAMEDQADRDARRAALAAKAIADLEQMAAAIDARADYYDANRNAITAGNAVNVLNGIVVPDLTSLARMVAESHQMLAHMIRVLGLDEA